MKVGICVRRFGPVGGMERVAHGFVDWMAARGHSVDVWCNDFEPVDGEVRHRPLGAGGRGVGWRALSLARAASAVPVDKYDGFLHFERGGNSAVYRAGAGCHAAYRSHVGGGFGGGWIQRIDQRSCVDARQVVVNSEMVRDELQQFYGIDKAKIRLVRNGVDLQRFRPGERSASPMVVFVGSDARRKGLSTAIEAVSRLPGVQLVVLGQVANAARRWAAAAGVADRVRFMGEVENPEHIVSQAHAMVLPTRYDPSANAVLEALACGVPAITTATNGAAELLPAPWMILDDPMDADHCAEVLACAMNDESLAADCRAIAESHGMDASFGALLQVMTEAAC